MTAGSSIAMKTAITAFGASFITSLLTLLITHVIDYPQGERRLFEQDTDIRAPWRCHGGAP